MKHLFLDPFQAPFGLLNLRTRFLWWLFMITSCKKSKTFWTSVFHKTWKTSFWAHFALFWPKKSRLRFLSKYPELSLFKLDDALISWKKLASFYWCCRKKLWTNRQTYKLTNRLKVSHRTFTSCIQQEQKKQSLAEFHTTNSHNKRLLTLLPPLKVWTVAYLCPIAILQCLLQISFSFHSAFWAINEKGH